MDAIAVVDTIHWVFAFLVILCAVALGWVQVGQRVMVTVIGVQVLIGIVFAAMLGSGIAGLGARIGEHVLCALLAMGAYIAARRLGAAGSRGAQIGLAALGLVLLGLTAYVGLKMHGRIA